MDFNRRLTAILLMYLIINLLWVCKLSKKVEPLPLLACGLSRFCPATFPCIVNSS